MKHPAPFSKELYPTLVLALIGYNRVLDPFAGIGRIHEIGLLAGCETVGVEIEPEWAEMHPRTIVGDALALPFEDESFDAVCTSPCYGNRMADSHNAQDGSYRRTYTHLLGRKLHPANSGKMQWGQEYREFHQNAWVEIARVCGTRLVLNISDHVRSGKKVGVTDFHVDTLISLGFRTRARIPITTKRFRYGENDKVREPNEWVIVFER